MSDDPGLTAGSTVAVLGLGLIGGSLARDLAGQGIRVIAYDRDVSTQQRARDAGVVSGELDDSLRDLLDADVVVIATPVDEAHGMMRRIAAVNPGGVRLVMDMGSTKTGVLATAIAHGLGDRFVGSHPLAGDHASGWGASRAGLFVGARVFVCPAPGTTAGSLALAMALWKSLGAVPERMDAREHDERLAWSSHLPQLLSSALGVTLSRAGVPRSELGPGGRDMTRLAGSATEVWVPIAHENAAAVVAALAALEGEVRAMRDLLLRPDADLTALLNEASAWFNTTGGAVVAADGGPADERVGATPAASGKV